MRPRAALAIGVVLALVSVTSASAEVRKAVGSIEITDPAGDINPINTSDGKVPGFDVVKLSISSDGKQIRIGATLKDPPSDYASDVVRLYIDTDNNPKTGVKPTFIKELDGFEFQAWLHACADYANGASACTGGMDSKAKLHFGAVNLERLKGTDEFGNVKTDTVVDSMGFGKRKASSKIPIEAKLVQATLDYADLGAKPGQTIRILAQESCADITKLSSFFPEIHLTLK